MDESELKTLTATATLLRDAAEKITPKNLNESGQFLPTAAMLIERAKRLDEIVARNSKAHCLEGTS